MARRLPRCIFSTQEGARCRNPGLGDPPLCSVHLRMYEERDVLGEVFEVLTQQRSFTELKGTITEMVNEAVRKATAPKRIEQGYPFRRPAPPPGRGYHSSTGAPSPGQTRRPRPAAPPPPREDPRVVLGFPPGKPLTRDEIKQRRRKLASILHADQGGSDESMKRLNRAVDELLAQVA
jgi:hypothetical protein